MTGGWSRVAFMVKEYTCSQVWLVSACMEGLVWCSFKCTNCIWSWQVPHVAVLYPPATCNTWHWSLLKTSEQPSLWWKIPWIKRSSFSGTLVWSQWSLYEWYTVTPVSSSPFSNNNWLLFERLALFAIPHTSNKQEQFFAATATAEEWVIILAVQRECPSIPTCALLATPIKSGYVGLTPCKPRWQLLRQLSL